MQEQFDKIENAVKVVTRLCHEHLTAENRFVAGLCKACRTLRENGAQPPVREAAE